VRVKDTSITSASVRTSFTRIVTRCTSSIFNILLMSTSIFNRVVLVSTISTVTLWNRNSESRTSQTISTIVSTRVTFTRTFWAGFRESVFPISGHTMTSWSINSVISSALPTFRMLIGTSFTFVRTWFTNSTVIITIEHT